MKKMNNKGFSLVELIVVVLIMAIIAVALAPQVMKWVENSRKSTDCNNYDSVVSAVNIALANENVMKEVAKGAVTLTWSTGTGNNRWAISWSGSGTSLDDSIKATIGENWKDMQIKRTTDLPAAVTKTVGGASVTAAANTYVIYVTNNGTVTRISDPSANGIS